MTILEKTGNAYKVHNSGITGDWSRAICEIKEAFAADFKAKHGASFGLVEKVYIVVQEDVGCEFLTEKGFKELRVIERKEFYMNGKL